MTRRPKIPPNLERDMKTIRSLARPSTAIVTSVMCVTLLIAASISAASGHQTRRSLPTAFSTHNEHATKLVKDNTSFSILSFSPYTVQNSSVKMTISTTLADPVFTIAVLSPTNTRSELFDFADNLGKRSVKSSIEIPLSEFTPNESTSGEYTIDIPVNLASEEGKKSLTFGTSGVYPIAISTPTTEKKVNTEYTFISHVPTVGSSGSAYSQKLTVLPLVKFSPFINRMSLMNEKNELTEYGLNTRKRFSTARATIDAMMSTNTPLSAVLSPEAIDTNSILNQGSPAENIDTPLFPTQASGTEYVPDTYTPINIAELQKQDVSSAYTELLTLGRTQITKAGYGSTARTLVTQTITPESIERIAQSGIDNVIVDETTFARGQRPTNKTVTLQQKSALVRVGVADTAINTHLSSELSSTAQANYLLAATTVVTLEAPSVARGLILPLDLSRLNQVTVTQFLQGTMNNPLIIPVTSNDYFSQLKSDKAASEKLSKADYPTSVSKTFDKEQFASVAKFSRATQSMFSPNTQEFSHAFWMENGVYSRADREVSSVINPSSAETLTMSVESKIALPEKRTLTITSRENKIPVTIKNSSGSPITVVVHIDSDKLAFPEGQTFPVVLKEQNTTVKIPVKARTSGSFPITVKIVSPVGGVEVAQQNATVRSTVVSGAGIAIAVGAALFLALWWGSSIRKSRKKPLAPVIELSQENAG